MKEKLLYCIQGMVRQGKLVPVIKAQFIANVQDCIVERRVYKLILFIYPKTEIIIKETNLGSCILMHDTNLLECKQKSRSKAMLSPPRNGPWMAALAYPRFE